jgi:HPt (histidine-containing phosphotransfer) domain-containing protein
VNNIEPLDVNLLEGYLESLGLDIVEQMLALYIQQSITYLDDISDSLEQKSQALWEERCHKMKGATGSVGLLAAHAKLVAIEKISGQWAEKSTYMSELIEVNRNAIEAFNTWLASK